MENNACIKKWSFVIVMKNHDKAIDENVQKKIKNVNVKCKKCMQSVVSHSKRFYKKAQ